MENSSTSVQALNATTIAIFLGFVAASLAITWWVCRSPTAKAGGVSFLQMSMTYGQRGWNGQPLGTSIALGTPPVIGMIARRRLGSGTGMAATSACV